MTQQATIPDTAASLTRRNEEILKSSSIKTNIKWGGYRAAFRYILASENGGAGDVEDSPFEEIWANQTRIPAMIGTLLMISYQ